MFGNDRDGLSDAYRANWGDFGGWLRGFSADTSAAVASTYAIAMFVLVGIAGVAWDWTRMTAMDSELQNAADQAALAAASQLDGQDEAIARATAAASNLVINISRMANDGDSDGNTVTVAEDGLTFYDGYNQISDDFGDVTEEDADARVVTVTIKPREAVYAMTPVVGLLRSGGVSAQATAALGSAICNTPPVMICNPLEDDNEDFNPGEHIGKGLKLLTSNDNGAPGNFGFLANGYDQGNGTGNLARALGYDNVPGNCQAATGVTTEPGQKDVVFNAINTRFDLDINGNNTCPSDSTLCSSAPISRKDLVKDDTKAKDCGITGKGWAQAAEGSRYIPPGAQLLNATERAAVKVMGYPRDLCHAWSLDGDCDVDDYGVIGTGDWDRDAFFEVNFGWDSATWKSETGLGSNATRYQVYLWEVGREANGDMTNAQKFQAVSGKTSANVPVCRAKGDASRRTMTAAVINCQDQNVQGRTPNVKVHAWVEVFLVEPSLKRKVAGSSSDDLTDQNDVYVEVVRTVDAGGDAGEGDVVRRDVPYLIR